MTHDTLNTTDAVNADAVRTCQGCGCTDDRACPGGCWWVPGLRDLCSSCAPPANLRFLLEDQELYSNVRWQSYDGDDERQPTRNLGDAVAVGSRIRDDEHDRHHVLLDIDWPAWLIPSSTPGHSHLYIEVGGGVPWTDLKELLRALAACGVIEHGYAFASIDHGSTTLRLPWVKKDRADQRVIALGEDAEEIVGVPF